MKWTPSKLRELRIGLGWSAAQLSRRLGFPVKTVLDWEAGRGEPSEDVAQELDQLEFHRDDCARHTSEAPKAEKSMKDQGLSQIDRRSLNEIDD